jgi:type IV fimbrial biogenesis protein FimT
VRGTADSLQSGLVLARATAIRRNQNVDFVMTNDTIDLGSAGTVTPATNGQNWLVRVLDPSTGTYELVQSKSGAEGSGAVEGASTVQVNGSVGQVTFRGLGGTQGLGATATFDFSNPAAGACNTVGTPGPIRCLRVQVSVAGLVRICDPSTTAPDSRAC